MKKKIISVLVVVLFLFGFTTNANAEIKADDLEATLQDEIKQYGSNESYKDYIDLFKSIDTDKYAYSSDKINVYVFRGSTCGYCLNAIHFFSSILEEYGDYFNLVTYQVWNNEDYKDSYSDNGTLLNNVADALGEEVEGVPFIVIGDQTFAGYASDWDDDIIAAIENAYENKDGDYVDVVASVLDGDLSFNVSKNKNSDDNSTAITIIIILVVVAGIGFLIYMAKDNEVVIKEEKVTPKKVSTTKKKTTNTTSKKTTTAKKTTKK